MGTAAAVYQQRKEQGICTRAGCAASASEESSLCEPHHTAARIAARDSKARLRRRRRRLRLCVHCGRDRPKGLKACLKCLGDRNRIRPVRSVPPGVNKADAIAAATRTHADGRTRYHGQGKRGMQPRAQLNRQDIEMARDALARGERELARFESPEAAALPRMQRDGIRDEAAHAVDLAGRHLDDVLERLGHFKARHGRRDGE